MTFLRQAPFSTACVPDWKAGPAVQAHGQIKTYIRCQPCGRKGAYGCTGSRRDTGMR